MLKICIKSIIVSTLILLLFTSCKKKPQVPANILLNKGLKYAKSKKYDSCISELSKIDDLYPYSSESKSAAPVLIYCHYMNKDYETVYPMIESFESLYPTSDQISYLYYIKGLAYFRSIKNHKKSMQIIDNLENTITSLNERDSSSIYAQNLSELLPFIAQIRINNQIYTAQNYVITHNHISAAERYSNLLKQDLTSSEKEKLENSFLAVLQNLGAK